MPAVASPPAGSLPVAFKVELPAGGFLHLQTPDEVDFWKKSQERYSEEYTLSKQNDLIALGQLLQQQVILFRAQTAINGMEPDTDSKGIPTGHYKRVDLDAGETLAWQKTMTSASVEMRALEKSLGIDKVTREAGGTHTTDNYIKTLKRAAHQRGIHIAKRTLEYERLVNELRVRLRLLYSGDEEDRKYHGITPKTLLDWLKEECVRLEEVDKKHNNEKGRLFLGKL
jgi:hypothetical protein